MNIIIIIDAVFVIVFIINFLFLYLICLLNFYKKIQVNSEKLLFPLHPTPIINNWTKQTK